jgi:hypothetical protein
VLARAVAGRKQLVHPAIEVQWVDLIGTHERIDRTPPRSLIGEGRARPFQLDVFFFRMLEALDNLVIGNLAMRGADFGIVNSLMVRRVKEVEMYLGVLLDFSVDGLNFERDQPETNLAPPRAESQNPRR